MVLCSEWGGGGDTRQPQTGADAADMSQLPAIVLFIPLCHISSQAVSQTPFNRRGHLRLTHVMNFHNSVWCVFFFFFAVCECARGQVYICHSSEFPSSCGWWWCFWSRKWLLIVKAVCVSVSLCVCVSSGNISNPSMLTQPSATPCLSSTPTHLGIHLEMFY